MPKTAEMMGMIPLDMMPTDSQGIISADGTKFTTKPLVPYTTEARFRVDKRESRIRYENETEDAVDVVIEPKDKQ